MFKTIRSKLIAIIALILLLTASVTIYFTHRDVGREVMRIEQNNVENILDSVFVNVQGVYRSLISDRVRSIEQTKERLKRETGVVLSSLDIYPAEMGVLSGEAPGLQEKFMAWLEEMDTGTTNFFIADSSYRIVFDSEGMLVDRNLADIKDIKGQPLSDVINRPGMAYDQYVVFAPGECSAEAGIQRLGYLRSFPRWDWILGAFVDISYIEEAENERLAQLIQGFENQFRQVRIAETGSLFIFSSDSRLIVPPERVSDIPKLQKNLPELIRTAGQNEPVAISVDQESAIAFTRHFRPLDWYLSALIPEAEIRAPAQALVQNQSIIVAGIFLLGALIAMMFVRHIARPLGMLAREAEDMARRDLTGEEPGADQLNKLIMKYRDEVGALAGSFMFMQEELRKNVRQLVKTTAAKERYQSELNMARDIQMSIVPKTFPPFPEIKEFDLFATLEPAREVGGDLYDFFMLDDNHLCFTLGDVSDKGMPAALYMAITRTLIQSHSAKEKSPARIMDMVNNDLSKDNPKSMFVTLIIGTLNIKTGHVDYANAGHNLPVIMGGDGKCTYVQGISGPVAGAMEGMTYKELSLQLKPGDGLFIYSDGITEAMNPRQELYSDERLLKDIGRIQNADATGLIKNIREQVVEFSDGAPQSDDITMLVLRFNGRSA